MQKASLCLKGVYSFFFVNKLSNAELRMAYQEQQTKRSVILLAVYAVGTLGFLLPVLVPTFKVHTRDHYDHRERFPELKQFYKPLDDDLQLDANYHKLVRDQKYVIAQYMLVLLSIFASMILLCKTKWYFRVLPYTLALITMCWLPFWPVINFKICVFLAMGNVVFIVINVLFDGESLAQHLILVACELSVLLYRLKFVMPYYGDYFQPKADAVSAIFVLIIVGLISSYRNTDFKEAFMQKFALQKQKDDFEEILNSFPEAALIVEDHQQESEEANRVANQSARPLDPERRDQDEPVKVPIVKMLNAMFERLFATETVGFNTFLASKVFRETSIASERRSGIASGNANALTEKLSMIEILS